MWARTADHPRIRGENLDGLLRVLLIAGSPPHTRGKSGSGLSVFGGMDHPRIRGENRSQEKNCIELKGSPPHTRGKFKDLRSVDVDPRITPAYAGKIPYSADRAQRGWDHPRIRGENLGYTEEEAEQEGSPPHTRGK